LAAISQRNKHFRKSMLTVKNAANNSAGIWTRRPPQSEKNAATRISHRRAVFFEKEPNSYPKDWMQTEYSMGNEKIKRDNIWVLNFHLMTRTLLQKTLDRARIHARILPTRARRTFKHSWLYTFGSIKAGKYINSKIRKGHWPGAGFEELFGINNWKLEVFANKTQRISTGQSGLLLQSKC